MTPTDEIIPRFKLPPEELVVYAQNQPDYIPLPMWRGPEGLRVSCWRLTWRERLQILLGGRLWLLVMTFDRPLQPVRLVTKCPLSGSAMLDEEV